MHRYSVWYCRKMHSRSHKNSSFSKLKFLLNKLIRNIQTNIQLLLKKKQINWNGQCFRNWVNKWLLHFYFNLKRQSWMVVLNYLFLFLRILSMPNRVMDMDTNFQEIFWNYPIQRFLSFWITNCGYHHHRYIW